MDGQNILKMLSDPIMFELNFNNIFGLLFLSIFFTVLNIFIHSKLIKHIKVPEGPQKIHKGNISRFGGTSILATLVVMSVLYVFSDYTNENMYFKYVLISIPVFFWLLRRFYSINQPIFKTFRIFA